MEGVGYLMGALQVRGGYLSVIRVGRQLMGFSNDQLANVYHKSMTNSNAHVAGATVGQAELITASLRTIERGAVKQSGNIDSSKINMKELRAMIEEYGNLAKITR